jgi:hypothetical protein
MYPKASLLHLLALASACILSPAVFAAPQFRILLESAQAPAPIDTADPSAADPQSAPPAAAPSAGETSGSTLESGGVLCEGQGNNAATFNFAIGEYNAKVFLDYIFPVELLARFILLDPTIVERSIRARPGSSTLGFINNLYVDTGKDRIVVDAGQGPAGNGTLYEELQVNGIHPDSITKVLITHGHGDHVNGLLRDAAGTPAFPNAKIYISRTEWDFWTAPNVNISGIALPPEVQAELVQAAKTVFNAVRHLTEVPCYLHVTFLVYAQEKKNLLTFHKLPHSPCGKFMLQSLAASGKVR